MNYSFGVYVLRNVTSASKPESIYSQAGWYRVIINQLTSLHDHLSDRVGTFYVENRGK